MQLTICLYILQYLTSIRLATYNLPIFFALSYIHVPRNLAFANIFCKILYPYASELTIISPTYFAISCIHMPRNLPFAHIFCNILCPYALQLTNRPYILQYFISICLETYHSPIHFAISYIHTPHNLPLAHIFCNILYPYASQLTIRPSILQYLIFIRLTTYHLSIYFPLTSIKRLHAHH